MNLEEFSNHEEVVGFSKKPVLQKTVKGTKYFDLQIPKATEQSLDLSPGTLLNIKIRNQNHETLYFKRETSQRTGGLKIYLPRNVIEELNIDEDSLLDVFISKD